MKKIVINACYGGFSLSAIGLDHYFKLRGEKIYFFELKELNRPYKFTPLSIEDAATKSMFYSYTSETPTEETHFSSRDIKRDDPLLIRTVEEIGSSLASGRHARLKIVEIPDDVKWVIAEYDGHETVDEEHRIWS